MRATYTTTVIGAGNHASIHVPDEILAELGANRRAPLKVTIGGHTYRSTATAVNGDCRVVFPQADRDAAGAKAGDIVGVIGPRASVTTAAPANATIAIAAIRETTRRGSPRRLELDLRERARAQTRSAEA